MSSTSTVDWKDLNLSKHIENGLRAVGLDCQAQASDILQRNGLLDSGRLANSISYSVAGFTSKAGNAGVETSPSYKVLHIGTSLMYAAYVEYGTGIYADGGGGRQTPWVYYDKSKKKFFRTRGMKPQPFLRPVLNNHRRILSTFLTAFTLSLQRQ